MRGLVGLAATALFASCGRPSYVCSFDQQCVDRGIAGRCEPQGFCSFPDDGCPSGSRFESNAGNELGGTCVPEGNTPPDGFPACGAVGMACCPDQSCVGNAFCDGGTCTQCITEVAHGIAHSCFLKHDGTVWCSGSNEVGQLGNGGFSTVPVTTVVQVRDSTNAAITDAIAIGGGGETACAIRADRTVWCWGAGNVCGDLGGQLGNSDTDNSAVAVQVVRLADDQPLTEIAEVYGSFCHFCARDMAGGVWCWGSNFDGQLGTNSTNPTDAAVRVLTAGGAPVDNAVQLTVGADHNCLRTTDDEVFCWGGNSDGEVGDGTFVDRLVATRIQDLQATDVSAGRFHTCAVRPDSSIACWGSNRHGRLGNGEGEHDDELLREESPISVLDAIGGTVFTGAARVENGAMSCTVTTSGAALCWGMNAYGQTGNAGQFVPAPVLDQRGMPLTLVSRIFGRWHRACALRTTGELVCWGRNSEGQLGDGTFTNRGLATPGAGPTCP